MSPKGTERLLSSCLFLQKSYVVHKNQVQKCLSQCNHVRAKPILVCSPKRSAEMDDKCKQPGKYRQG
ncbi:unnamed protein product [Hymenolepis diminuta]|uniref:Uncharacterized protein n=1 Tax=Hymenolepis diminuta TaxID=6216 RepID=A0A564ZCQ1_HYMDI|nr:unnamed protein product [Hymenolepis diminuta]